MLPRQGRCEDRQALPRGVFGERDIAGLQVEIGEGIEIIAGQEVVATVHLGLDRDRFTYRLDCAILVALNRPAAYASSAGKRERGANLFLTRGCVRCHSITGVGGSRAPDLGSVGLRRQAPQIKKQILNGGHGMPPFKDVLTKDQVKDLVAFLTSCRTSMAPGCRTWMPAEPSQ